MATAKKFTKTKTEIIFQREIKTEVPNLFEINNHVCKLIKKHGNPIANGCTIGAQFGFLAKSMWFDFTIFNNQTNRSITIYEHSSERYVKEQMDIIEGLFNGSAGFEDIL